MASQVRNTVGLWKVRTEPAANMCGRAGHLRSIIKQDEYLVVYCGGKSHAHSRNFCS